MIPHPLILPVSDTLSELAQEQPDFSEFLCSSGMFLLSRKLKCLTAMHVHTRVKNATSSLTWTSAPETMSNFTTLSLPFKHASMSGVFPS